jgi:hypothetical protein
LGFCGLQRRGCSRYCAEEKEARLIVFVVGHAMWGRWVNFGCLGLHGRQGHGLSLQVRGDTDDVDV